MTIPAELEYFTVGHRPHGALIAETGELTPNGYRLTVACPCGVTFQRWITPRRRFGISLRWPGLTRRLCT
jgi:hypothetical protein